MSACKWGENKKKLDEPYEPGAQAPYSWVNPWEWVRQRFWQHSMHSGSSTVLDQTINGEYCDIKLKQWGCFKSEMMVWLLDYTTWSLTITVLRPNQ